MKHLLLPVFCIVSSFGLQAQVKVDAGSDKAWCLNLAPPQSAGPILGGNPTATGGAAPYQYLWTILETGFDPQDYLDYNNSPTPQLRKVPPQSVDSLHFIVQVTDASSAVGYDTAKVYFSRWRCTLGECGFNKAAADTVSLSGRCQTQFRPFTYRWSPGMYLSDSTVANPKSWTPVTQTYEMVLTDSKGCSMIAGNCTVIVGANSVSGVEGANDIVISPNPVSEQTRLQCGSTWLGGHISVFTATGALCGTLKITKPNLALNCLIPETAGLYFYQIMDEQSAQVRRGKLIRQ